MPHDCVFATIDAMAYGISFHIGLAPNAVGALVAHAALWLVGIATLVVVLVPVIFFFTLRGAAKRSGR